MSTTSATSREAPAPRRREVTGDARARAQIEPVLAALAHLETLQWQSGAWEGEVVWCPIITAQYVIVRTITSSTARDPQGGAGGAGGAGPGELTDEQKRLLIQQFRATRTPDGVWGLHLEAGGYVFITAMSYVALRLLGLPADDPMCAQARAWLHARSPGHTSALAATVAPAAGPAGPLGPSGGLPAGGGVLGVPTWGKFWLAMLGLYGWEGVNPFPPELYVLPEALPVHPNRYYCHTRYIYMGIAYLYGRRFQHDLGPLGDELRGELYTVPYQRIDFRAHRHRLAPSDLYVRPGMMLRTGYDILSVYEKLASGPARALRQHALDTCFRRITFEQHASRYQGISPVNGLLNCLTLFDRDPHGEDLKKSLEGLESWRWQDEQEGIRYAGAHSTAWDTAFVLRAALEAPAEAVVPSGAALRRAYGFLRDTQILEELPGGAAERRDPILGGWCFSDGVHRWAVSDCTAEALSGIVAYHRRIDDARDGAAAALRLLPEERIGDDRLRQAVEFILRRQNADGGFGTYERRRAGSFLENLNPSEMYGNCMTERSYIECTSSCIGGLARLRDTYPDVLPPALRGRVDRAIERGARFLISQQRPDGSYAAFWGVNFTYAAFHVAEGLLAAGISPGDRTLARLAAWVESKQRPDGSWGEHYTGCHDDRYVEHAEPQPIMTAWAALTLLHLLPPSSRSVTRAVEWLAANQKADGSWPKKALAGVFFGTAMLDYRLYKDVFPLWALARHAAARAHVQA